MGVHNTLVNKFICCSMDKKQLSVCYEPIKAGVL
jgi:hypothetical protein